MTFKVIVHRAVSHRISVRGDAMEILKKNKICSVSMLANILGVSSRTISRDINRLKAEGKLKRVGNENTGYWEVL